MRDLQKKQTNKLMYCRETADSSCGIDHTVGFYVCFTPPLLKPWQSRNTDANTTPLPGYGHLCCVPVTSSGVNPEILTHICVSVVTGCTALVHSRLAATAGSCQLGHKIIHLAYSVSWEQMPTVCVLHAIRFADSVARKSKFECCFMWK